jgi:Translation initiation factor eIF3 subunit
MTEDEIMAEKARAQRLVEESDNKLTEELFGDMDISGPERSREPVSKGIADFNLGSSAGVTEFIAALSTKVEAEIGKPIAVARFLKDVLSALTQPLKADDVKTIQKSLTVVFNEKLKSEKGPKKKSKKKKALNIGPKSGGDLTPLDDGGYYDEYDDFM